MLLGNEKHPILRLFYSEERVIILHQDGWLDFNRIWPDLTLVDCFFVFNIFYFLLHVGFGLDSCIISRIQTSSKQDLIWFWVKTGYRTRCEILNKILPTAKQKMKMEMKLADRRRSGRILVKSGHPPRCKILIRILSTEKYRPNKVGSSSGIILSFKPM